jgi:hypothetical protein
LGSTNGTFINRQRIQESALYAGQTLQIGPVEMVLDTRAARVAVPEMPKAENPFLTRMERLADGHPACQGHTARHAVWECTKCGRNYCDECVRKLRRVGGAYLRLCPACSNKCRLTAWSESIKRRKRSMLSRLADKVVGSFKRTSQILNRVAAQAKKRSTRKTN